MSLPGPANYTQRASVGPQVSSKYKSNMAAGFGSSTVAQNNKLYLSKEHEHMHFGKTGPGAAAPYSIGPSVGPQMLSKDASQPRWGFGSEDRWAKFNKELKSNTTPGPGQYDPLA